MADAEILNLSQTSAQKISCDGRAFLREFVGIRVKWKQVQWLVISIWLESCREASRCAG